MLPAAKWEQQLNQEFNMKKFELMVMILSVTWVVALASYVAHDQSLWTTLTGANHDFDQVETTPQQPVCIPNIHGTCTDAIDLYPGVTYDIEEIIVPDYVSYYLLPVEVRQ
jgi:hypothetical protein